MLEFVKPVTLSMRLFGNIYGGEVALGVITSLTIAIFPLGAAQPGAHAQRHPGADLQRADPDLHHPRHREPPRGGGPHRRGWRARRARLEHRGSSLPTEAPSGAVNQGPNEPRADRSGSRRKSRTWNTSAPDSPLSGSSAPASASASWPACPATAIGRNPDAAGQIRGLAIILAAFAEGLGVLAIVVGLLAIFIQPA